jgi:hypothetical protein
LLDAAPAPGRVMAMPKDIAPTPIINPLVPDELLVQVLCGLIDETVAIERGRLAAAARSPEERRGLLVPAFATTPPTTPPLVRRCGPMPWHEP